MGWDPAEKTYTYFATNTMGEIVFSRGTVQGDTWTWNNESKMNGKPVRARFTLKQVSPIRLAISLKWAPPTNP